MCRPDTNAAASAPISKSNSGYRRQLPNFFALMKKLIFAVLFLEICSANPLLAGATDQAVELRRQLRSADDISKCSNGAEAYSALMHLGNAGFEILANSWAYDQIPEENWLQWDTDFLQRYGKGVNNDIDDAYASTLSVSGLHITRNSHLI